jgi:hypothetical protein
MIQLDLINKIYTEAQGNDELPEHVASSIYEVLNITENLKGKEASLNQLLEQIREYDPHADIGCFGGGVSLTTIIKTINSLK